MAVLVCFEEGCREQFALETVIYNCPRCGGLLEVQYPEAPPLAMKQTWRERRMSNHPLDQSGVWRYREAIPFLDDMNHAVTLREGCTPLLSGPKAAQYGGLDALVFKHQGFNPTASFKDNGMTCGVAQAVRLGRKRVACVSTGNTSASMAAYAAAAGLDPLIFHPEWKHFLRQAGAGSGIWREDVPGGREFRPDFGVGARVGGKARHLSAEFHQSISD